MGNKNSISKNMIYIYLFISTVLGIIQILQGDSFYLVMLTGLLQVFSVLMLLTVLIEKRRYQQDTTVDEETNELLKKLLEGMNDSDENKSENKVVSKEDIEYINPGDYLYRILILIICAVFILLSSVILFKISNLVFNTLHDLGNLAYPLAVNVIQVIVYIFFSKWYQEQRKKNEKANLWFVFARVNLIASILMLIVMLFSLIPFQIGMLISMILATVIVLALAINIVISTSLKIIRKQTEDSVFDIDYLSVILSTKKPLSRITDYLEKNTNLTLRSLWSIKFLKGKIPMFLMLILLVMWLGTCFIQVNNQQQAVIMRFGKIQADRVLDPGLHLKLPWPIEKTGIYEVSRIKTFTVGYEAQNSTDYLWTMEHDGEEYKLLLGDGKELVSVNIKVAYKINNLLDYLLNYNNPEVKLQGEAYQLIMEETVTTNLDSLLSENRYMLSDKIQESLNEIVVNNQLGLEVTDVSIQSIHPPVEVAASYQEVVSAKIQKESLKNIALAQSKSAIPAAMVQSETLINNAVIEQLDRKATAVNETALFVYQYEAYKEEEEFYRWRKWLEAYEKALEGKVKYIIEEDSKIDEDNLWFGNGGFFMGGY